MDPVPTRLRQALVEVTTDDITRLRVDAIVHSCNTRLAFGWGRSVGAAISRAAGPELEAAVRRVPRPIPIGSVVGTPAYRLPCKWVLHAATHGTYDEERAAGPDPGAIRLESIGRVVGNSLAECARVGGTSIAFPLLAMGALRVPATLALPALVNSLEEELALQSSITRVVLVAYSSPTLAEMLANLVRVRALEAGLDTPAAPRSTSRAATRTSEEPVANSTKSAAISRGLAAIGGLAAVVPTVGAATTVDGLRWFGRHAVGRTAETVRGIFGAPAIERAARPVRRIAQARSGLTLMARGAIESLRTRAGTPSVPRHAASPTHASSPGPASHHASQLADENDQLRRRIADLEARYAGRPADPANGADDPELAMPAAFAENMALNDDDASLRVENVRKALAIVLRYLAALSLAEYEAAGAFDPGTNGKIREAFAPRGDGRWIHIMVAVAKVMAGRSDRFFDAGPDFWFRGSSRYGALLAQLDKLVKLRNQVHDLGATDESTARKWLDEALPIWVQMIREARPLLSYPLLSVTRIVDFPDDDHTSYQVRWLMGDHLIAKSESVTWRARLRRNTLQVFDPRKSGFLCLSPFMKYEHCQISRAAEPYCIDHIEAESFTFATFRFPHSERWAIEPPKCLTG